MAEHDGADSSRYIHIGGYPFVFLGDLAGRNARWAALAGRGGWETPVIDFLRASLRPRDMFLDIGAYFGPYTLLASRLVQPSGRVHALEPDPPVFEILRRNVAANNADNVTSHQVAISSRDGFSEFHSTADSMSRLRMGGEHRVETISLLSLCEQIGRAPDVVKIDIEGGEAGLIDEGHRILPRVRAGVLEVHISGLSERDADVPSMLRALGPYRELCRKSEDNFHVVFGTDIAGTVV